MKVIRVGTFLNETLAYLSMAACGEELEIIVSQDIKLRLTVERNNSNSNNDNNSWSRDYTER